VFVFRGYLSRVNVKQSYVADLCFDAMLWVHHVLQKNIKKYFCFTSFNFCRYVKLATSGAYFKRLKNSKKPLLTVNH